MFLFVIIVAIGAAILVTQHEQLFQQGSLEDSQALLDILDEEFGDSTIHDDIADPATIVVVHNGGSEQCQRALRFLEKATTERPSYETVIYTIDHENYLAPLADLPEGECWIDSQVVNQWFVYPTIFVHDQVFVGYSYKTRKEILKMLEG